MRPYVHQSKMETGTRLNSPPSCSLSRYKIQKIKEYFIGPTRDNLIYFNFPMQTRYMGNLPTTSTNEACVIVRACACLSVCVCVFVRGI